MTELETLDLSFNELTEFSGDDYNFTFPENLMRLFASNNKLRHISIGQFSNLTTLKLIDLQNNSIDSLDSELLMKVRTGLNLFIAGISKF